MAKVTAENRDVFNSKMIPYKEAIDKSFEKEKEILATISGDSATCALRRLELCEEMIYCATLYMTINNISVEEIDVKNTEALNEARKMLYKAIIYLEEIVTNLIDAPYSEYEDKVEKIASVSLEKRYYIVRKVGLAIKLLVDSYGDNTKWKWSFVELEGRFAVVAKNLMNLRLAGKVYLEPSHEDYDTTVFYLRLLRKLFSQSANGYRDRYELSTHRVDDMRNAILFLAAYRRICVIMTDTEEADETKVKAGVWKQKLDSDTKKGISK